MLHSLHGHQSITRQRQIGESSERLKGAADISNTIGRRVQRNQRRRAHRQRAVQTRQLVNVELQRRYSPGGDMIT